MALSVSRALTLKCMWQALALETSRQARSLPVLSAHAVPPPRLSVFLPSLSGQFLDFLVHLRRVMLCCVLLSPDLGHCAHAALELSGWNSFLGSLITSI